MTDAEEVLVLGECLQGHLTPITGEIIAAGRQLADDLGIGVACGLMGDGLDGAARAAMTLGADRAYIVDDPLLARFQSELYLEALTRALSGRQPPCSADGPHADRTRRGASAGGPFRGASGAGLSRSEDRCLHQATPGHSPSLWGECHGHGPLHAESAICDGTPKSLQSIASTGPPPRRSDSHPGRP